MFSYFLELVEVRSIVVRSQPFVCLPSGRDDSLAYTPRILKWAIDAGKIATLEYTYCRLIDREHCASIAGIIGKIVNVYIRVYTYTEVL